MIELIVPILLSLAIGIFCKRKRLLTDRSVGELKNLVTTFFMPMVAFRMFSQADLEAATLALVAMSFTLQVLGLLIGAGTRRILGEYGRYSRFLMCSTEGGMIGIGLFQMIYGQDRLAYLAPFELGNGLFYFIVCLPLLSAQAGAAQAETAPLLERGRKTARAILSAPVFIGCLAGVLYQLVGLRALVETLGLSDALYACIDVFGALIMPLILISIGFELSFSRELLGPVVKTAALRACTMGSTLLLGECLLHLMGVNAWMFRCALAFEYALPPSFLTAVYVETPKQQRYVNAALSFYVFVTLLFALGFRLFLPPAP